MTVAAPRQVFVTGGTGYIGRRLVRRLLERGHGVRALVRPESVGKLPPGCAPVIGDALAADSFAAHVPPADSFVQLVGTPHPSPRKADEFRRVDLASVRASVDAAAAARVRHFVYVSVAHPAPVMQAYIAVRAEGERVIRERGLAATILRPWYVLGPGHRWPYALLPVYWLLERVPATRDGARRLGLVTIAEMVAALSWAVEEGPDGTRILDVERIRATSHE